MFAVAALSVASVDAAPIYGTLVDAPDFSGTRTEPANLTGTGRFDAIDLSWLITLSSGVYSYQYAFTFETTQNNSISHLILDLSDNCLETANQTACVSNARLNGTPISAVEFNTFGSGASNPGLPIGQTITGIKFDALSLNPEPNVWTITFDSTRAPMWGDIYLKAGREDYLFNNGLLAAHRLSDDAGKFIAVPDTFSVQQVPEPATIVLLTGGLIALARSRRKVR